MSRPSKAKRELRRKAILYAQQREALHSAIASRHSEDTNAPSKPRTGPFNRVQDIRSPLDGMASKALHGPRMWSAPEPVKIVKRDVGSVEGVKPGKGFFVNTDVRPSEGKASKRGNLDGFTAKTIEVALAIKSKVR